ncbi:MAG TPA: hypothetical protein VN180_07755, partial [Acidimicrobiia bacterium]|nr:hypothetical protein [Acidimicrobiia bacterium]
MNTTSGGPVVTPAGARPALTARIDPVPGPGGLAGGAAEVAGVAGTTVVVVVVDGGSWDPD